MGKYCFKLLINKYIVIGRDFIKITNSKCFFYWQTLKMPKRSVSLHTDVFLDDIIQFKYLVFFGC